MGLVAYSSRRARGAPDPDHETVSTVLDSCADRRHRDRRGALDSLTEAQRHKGGSAAGRDRPAVRRQGDGGRDPPGRRRAARLSVGLPSRSARRTAWSRSGPRAAVPPDPEPSSGSRDLGRRGVRGGRGQRSSLVYGARHQIGTKPSARSRPGSSCSGAGTAGGWSGVRAAVASAVMGPGPMAPSAVPWQGATAGEQRHRGRVGRCLRQNVPSCLPHASVARRAAPTGSARHPPRRSGGDEGYVEPLPAQHHLSTWRRGGTLSRLDGDGAPPLLRPRCHPPTRRR